MSNWIELENKKLDKTSVIYLDYQEESDEKEAELKVILTGGSEITLFKNDAVKVWEEFNKKKSVPTPRSSSHQQTW